MKTVKTKHKVEELTAKEVIGMLTPKHIVAILLLAGSSLIAVFTLGLKWEAHLRSAENEPIKAQLQIAQTNLAQLEEDIHFLRSKEKLIELTATLQFQAMSQGKKLRDIYPNNVGRRVAEETEFIENLKRYHKNVEELTSPLGDKDAVADLRISRAGPRTLIFRQDTTPWYVFRKP